MTGRGCSDTARWESIVHPRRAGLDSRAACRCPRVSRSASSTSQGARQSPSEPEAIRNAVQPEFPLFPHRAGWVSLGKSHPCSGGVTSVLLVGPLLALVLLIEATRGLSYVQDPGCLYRINGCVHMAPVVCATETLHTQSCSLAP